MHSTNPALIVASVLIYEDNAEPLKEHYIMINT